MPKTITKKKSKPKNVLVKKQNTDKEDIIILQCTFCHMTYDWHRDERPDGFGYCLCKKGRFLRDIGQNQMFNVLKEHPKNINYGSVTVYSIHGSQKLSAPHFQENTNKWTKHE